MAGHSASEDARERAYVRPSTSLPPPQRKPWGCAASLGHLRRVLPPDCLACRRSVYRILSLPQRDGQVLGTDLNRSESKRRSSEPDGLEHAAGETTAPEEALTATLEACDSSRWHVGQPFIEWCTSSSATVVNRLVATRGRPRASSADEFLVEPVGGGMHTKLPSSGASLLDSDKSCVVLRVDCCRMS